MRTDQLVDLLARGAGRAPRHVVPTRLGVAIAAGAAASAALSISTLGLNPGLSGMGAALVIKVAYVIGLLVAASRLADRASRPGAPLRGAGWSVAAVVLAMTALAVVVWTRTPVVERADLLYGRSWASCLWRVAALSVPALGAALWAVRGLAPTRPRVAGFAAGLMAGGLGALGYALFCPELSPVFVLAWYTSGILIPAVAGAMIGPRVLRW